MKISKNICSYVISFMLIVGMLYGSVLKNVVKAEVISGECGDELTWVLDDEGILTISGIGDMDGFLIQKSPWYGNDNIKNIIIEDGVTSIGVYAFQNCTGVISVTIPDSVT